MSLDIFLPGCELFRNGLDLFDQMRIQFGADMAQVMQKAQPHFHPDEPLAHLDDERQLFGRGIGLVDQYENFCQFVFESFDQREFYVARNVPHISVNALQKVVSSLIYRQVIVLSHSRRV